MLSPDLLAEVGPLADRFLAAGRKVYLVGGIVRDQLLGRPLPPDGDVDLTTDALPHEVKRLVRGVASAVWTQGERFGTIGCLIGRREYEITTHRGESYDAASRKPNVVYADTIDHDLARRDFTVNAMAVSLPEVELVDPFGGRDDLAAGVLRTPLSPEESFGDDPLRMLRAARFIPGYGLTPEPALAAAVTAMAPRLAIVSTERRRDELDKLLVVPDPRSGFRFLLDHGLGPFVVPELAMLGETERLATIEAVRATPAVLDLRLAALFTHVPGPDLGAHAGDRLRSLRYSSRTVRDVGRIVRGVEIIRGHDGDWSPPAVRRLARATAGRLDAAVQVAGAALDVSALEKAVDELRSREPLDELTPPLDGRAVMSELGISSGPEVGDALEFVMQLRIDEGVLDPVEARRRLGQWWRSRSVQRPID